MKKYSKLFCLLFSLLFILIGCGQNKLEKYNELITKSEKIEEYQYQERVIYGTNDLEMTKSVWVSQDNIKSTLSYAENIEDELTTYIDLKNNKSYLYYKNLNTAMEIPYKNENLKEFIIPFSKKINLESLQEKDIISIDNEILNERKCTKVVIESKIDEVEVKVEIWYDEIVFLPIKFIIYNDGKLIVDGYYENVRIEPIDGSIFDFPKNAIIQRFELPK